MKKSAQRRKHCALVVVRRSQNFSPRRRPHSGAGGGRRTARIHSLSLIIQLCTCFVICVVCTSGHRRQFPPGPWVRTQPLLRHGPVQTLVDPLTRPSFGKVKKSVTDVSAVLVITFYFSWRCTYRPSLVKIDARNFELSW